MSRRSTADGETERMLRRLADLVEDSDLERREVERRAGFNPGYLSQVLRGHVQLKHWHVLALLEATGQSPAGFFAAHFPPPREPARPLSPEVLAGLRVNADVVRVYSLGIEAIEGLHRRLEACERGLREVARTVLGERTGG